MFDPSLILLYVENPIASGAFYEALIGRAPVERSPTFVMFVLPSGLKLGLWARQAVAPTADARGGACELAVLLADDAAVDALHDAWRNRGLTILQAPTAMEFGHTFTAADPDGHRLRVYALAENPR